MKRVSQKGILLVSHYAPTPGMVDKYFDYCKRHHISVCMIKNPLFPKDNLTSQLHTPEKTHSYTIPTFLQFLLEGLYNLFYYKKYIKDFTPTVAICFDPLSFCNIYFFKNIYKLKKIVYYNLDYSRKRFNNPLMNLIYTRCNTFAYSKSDYFIYLTDTFIKDIDPNNLHKQRNILIRHPVELSLIQTKQEKIPHSLIYAGSLLYSVDFTNVLKALKRIKDEKISFILDIYGRKEDAKELEKSIVRYHLTKNVHFKGIIENSILVRNILPKYQIGICPYVLQENTKGKDHMFHGIDLTSKLVEYIAAGLPLVTTPLYSAFNLIKDHKFGYLVRTEDEWYDAIKNLLTSETLQVKLSRNARQYAKHYDESEIIAPLLRKLLV